MNEDAELEDEVTPREDGEDAAGEPLAEPLYDPLTEPWNDPTSLALVEYRLARRQAEWDGYGPIVTPRAQVPAPLARGGEEVAELRRRLRQETVVVPRRRRVWSVTVRELAETLLLAVLIFLAVRASMQNFRVEGASMEPSLQNGEYLIVNKLAYTQLDLSLFDWLPFFDSGNEPVHHLWDSPSRGDVIVFRAPTDPTLERDFIKRIIGVPGDVVRIDHETTRVYVNDELIEESYIQGRTTCQVSCGPWVVPEGSYFVMGDNRQNSSDSRQGWFVPEENIIGKALITYWHDNSPELGLAPNHKIDLISEAAAEE
jgi:signal peptidase I